MLELPVFCLSRYGSPCRAAGGQPSHLFYLFGISNLMMNNDDSDSYGVGVHVLGLQIKANFKKKLVQLAMNPAVTSRNLVQKMAFYGAYHTHPVNVLFVANQSIIINDRSGFT